MKICIWCKYGKLKGDNINEKILIQTRDCKKCPKCDRQCISGSLMVEE